VKILSDLAKSPGNVDCRMLKMVLSVHSLSNTECTENLLDVEKNCWTSYMDCVRNFLRFQQAIKENNLALCVYSVHQLCSLMFSSDRLNYARYLPFYYNQLQHLCHTHPGAELLLHSRGFGVSRSNVSPACGNAVDLTVEPTIDQM